MSCSPSNQIVELIDEFSHEFRTPLGNIMLAADVLVAGDGAARPDTLASLGSILGAEAVRLARMLETLVDWERLQLAQPLQRQWHVVDDLIGAAVRELGVLIEARHVEVSTEPEVAMVHGDDVRVVSLITQLIDAVAHYGREDESIQVEVVAGKQHCLVAVSTGGRRSAESGANSLGVDEAIAIGQRAAPGAGLGLVVAAQIVEAHGGEIWVEHDAQRRTLAFGCRLPNDGEPPDDMPDDSDAQSGAISATRGKNQP
jgi:two-component system, OmpR family, sensor histidine kinase KdpD